MDKVILLFCSFISCVIFVNILFHFFDVRYSKAFNSKILYILLSVISVIITAYANIFINPYLKLMLNVLWIGVVSFFFYYGYTGKKFICVFESEALLMVESVAEAFGVYAIDVIMGIMHIVPQSAEIQKSIETIFSEVVLLFLYFVVFNRLWKKGLLRTKTQYILYLMMFVYSVVNILFTVAVSNSENSLMLMAIMGCTIFANMYLLYFIKCADERNYYKIQVDMMQQQERIHFENYMLDNEKYNEAMSILHDIDKHMKIIEELYQVDLKKEALNYTNQIREMLQPLVPFRYTENPVLNCLLSNAKRVTDRNDISFEIETNEANIDFMKPIDITILFGNLIDNAIEASKECSKRRYIGLFIKEHNEMLSVRIENCIEKPVPIKNGIIDNTKVKRKGVGLLNIQRCIEDYLGSIIYKCSEQLLVCDIILNRLDK